ncbi:MAG: GNAT family N-acetyltransferase [Anaerolineae bacterium]|nr:GNAT family N-acetyltransferase [Anaerolineae bacterium]
MVEIFHTRDQVPTDADILSFWHMVFDPDQIRWEFEENQGLVKKPDNEVIHFFRSKVLSRETNYAFWARENGQIIGMAGIDRFMEPSKIHCAELGFGVRKEYRRRGIGYQLICAVLDKAREIGLKRIECSCFADNAAAISLLCKAGFRKEGVRKGAILKQERLRDISLFGLLL